MMFAHDRIYTREHGRAHRDFKMSLSLLQTLDNIQWHALSLAKQLRRECCVSFFQWVFIFLPRVKIAFFQIKK
jgi:hypothetical protein